MTITKRERQLMLDIAAAKDDGADPAHPLPWPVLAGLRSLIPAHTVALVQLDTDRRETVFDQQVGGPGSVSDSDWPWLLEAFWSHYWDSPCCCYPDVSGDLTTVTTVSDFHSDRALRTTAMYNDYFKHVDGERELMLCLPSQPGRILRLMFWRGRGRDFTQRDRDLLTLLRPHLYQVYRRRTARKPATLTDRQRQLLHLVANGHTNRQIGRQLGISEATVRKHLEHIYERLQVTSRTAAVTEGLSAGYRDEPA
jgi:DNA-binding CsgD family transcriptional regulator